MHFDSISPIVSAGDASGYGMGAVVSHVTPDELEHTIAFASRTLSSAERNSPQVEKRALSFIYRIKEFHICLVASLSWKPIINLKQPTFNQRIANPWIAEMGCTTLSIPI